MGIIVDPTPFDLMVYRGATCRIAFRWLYDGSPLDLSAATVRAQVRNRYSSANPLATFSAAGDAEGRIVATIPASVSANLLAIEGVWDLEVHWIDGDVCRLLAGHAFISPRVCRA